MDAADILFKFINELCDSNPLSRIERAPCVECGKETCTPKQCVECLERQIESEKSEVA